MDTNVSTTGVGGVASNVASVYAEIEKTMRRVDQFKASVPSFWTGAEATNMLNAMNGLSEKYQAFATLYDAFMESLGNLATTYNNEESKMIDAISGYSGN